MNVCYVGDCREIMRRLIAEGVKVQMCVTSPPYWGLRDYGVNGQFGLEKTPEEYVANMVEVFGLVRELLAEDGTLWINLGDSYAGSGKGGGGSFGPERKQWEASNANRGILPVFGRKPLLSRGQPAESVPVVALKPKDLIGIPWRVAFALQEAGWYLRQDIIWYKPNPMPESVRDRCTKAHEYLFLLSKRERYYFDQGAIAEPVAPSTVERLSQPTLEQQAGSGRVPGKTNGAMKAVPPRFGGNKYGENDAAEHRTKSGNEYNFADVRNRRSVWTVATQPFSGAHFATFPPALIEPCILAGSRPGDVVLDPFLGSGTTAQVAQRLGRNWLGCELNPEYLALQRQRTRDSLALPL